MFRIIRNKYIDDLRKKGRYEELPDEQAMADDIFSNPESKLEFKDMLGKIEACLAKLKTIYREVYVLTKVAGHSLEEVAELLNVKTETAKNRRRISYKHMKMCLTKKKDVFDEGMKSIEFIPQLLQTHRADNVSESTMEPEDDFPSDQLIDSLVRDSYKRAPMMLKKSLMKFL
jgi:hypothetical protein